MPVQDAIEQRRLPAHLGAVRRRARRGDPRAPRPRSRVAPRAGRSCAPTTATTASAPGPTPSRGAWKSVTVVLDDVREVDGCVVASGRSRPSTTRRAGRRQRARLRRGVPRRARRAGGLVLAPTTTRWPGSARAPHCPSERERLARASRPRPRSAPRRSAPAARRARGPGAMPELARRARRRARAAAAGPRRGARAPRPAPRGRARGGAAIASSALRPRVASRSATTEQRDVGLDRLGRRAGSGRASRRSSGMSWTRKPRRRWWRVSAATCARRRSLARRRAERRRARARRPARRGRGSRCARPAARSRVCGLAASCSRAPKRRRRRGSARRPAARPAARGPARPELVAERRAPGRARGRCSPASTSSVWPWTSRWW